MTHARIPLSLVPEARESKKWVALKAEIVEASANGEAIIVDHVDAAAATNLSAYLRRAGYVLHRRSRKEGGFILWVTPL